MEEVLSKRMDRSEKKEKIEKKTMCELWDAFDINLNLIEDMTLVRGERIPDGVYHLVCDIAVKHTDGMFLLMKRDINKHLGGMWQLTAGGSCFERRTSN